jgi:3-hydroxy-9,10-secoandrosta-1,3,5(10)-triene-9,17-dione monooxygenase reductase component
MDARLTREQKHFRKVMGNFPTGVTVVTSRSPDASPCGLTANSVASVSLHPLLVLVCVDRAASSHGCITEGGAFAISVLSSDDEDLARRFSEGRWKDRFRGIELREAVTGSPILARALAWMDCRVTEVYEAGDHSILVGEVVACDARDGEPLVFFRGKYHRMTL